MTIRSLTAAAVVLAAATAFASPAHAVKLWSIPNGVDFNGINFNGLDLNGRVPNGLDLNGKVINGLDLNGKRLNGRNAQGTASAVRVEVVGVVLPGRR